MNKLFKILIFVCIILFFIAAGCALINSLTGFSMGDFDRLKIISVIHSVIPILGMVAVIVGIFGNSKEK